MYTNKDDSDDYGVEDGAVENDTDIAPSTYVNEIVDEQNTAIDNALVSANGKNKVYFQPTQPSSTGNVLGDTWFDTDDGNSIYQWNGTAWVRAQIGTNAIAGGSITDYLIASGIDAGKITVGTLTANLIKAGILSTDTFDAPAWGSYGSNYVYISKSDIALLTDLGNYVALKMYSSGQDETLQFPSGVIEIGRPYPNHDVLRVMRKGLRFSNYSGSTVIDKQSILFNESTGSVEITPYNTGAVIANGNVITDANIGIGTTSPSNKLHVQSADDELARFESTDRYAVVRFLDGVASTQGVQVGCDGNDFYVSPNLTRTFTIKSGGRVGVGTVSPTKKLHVVGDTGANDGIVVESDTQAQIDFLNTSANGRRYVILSSAAGNLTFFDNNAGATRFFANNTGLVTYNAGFCGTTQTASSTTTLTNNIDMVFISGSTAWTLTLPTPLAGKRLTIVRTDATAFVITVSGHINGAAGANNTTWFPASTANRRVELVSNGTSWYPVIAGTVV